MLLQKDLLIQIKLKMKHRYAVTVMTCNGFKTSVEEKYSISEIYIYHKSEISNANEESDIQQLFPLFLIFGYIISASFLTPIKNWDISSFMLDFMGPFYGWIYPFFKVVLSLMFLMRFEIPIVLIVTLVLLGATIIGVVKTLLDIKSIPCVCLGAALKRPITKAAFIENSVMIIMTIIMLIKTYS